MSKRLQVILPDDEFETLKSIAKSQKTTLAEWVRQALYRAAQERPKLTADERIRALRSVSKHAFPAPSIEQMNREIEEGYGSGLP